MIRKIVIPTIGILLSAVSVSVLLYPRHEIQAPSLYDGFHQVTTFNNTNIERVLFEEQNYKLWLVEFYKHWCGDCIRFVPKIKALAFDIYEWRSTVGVGVINCADHINNLVCRNFKVEKVPKLRIFLPNSPKNALGLDFGKEGHIGYVAMREKIVSSLKTYHNEQNTIEGPVNLKLLPDCNLERLWGELPQNVQYLVLVFEEKDSLVGSQLALDISRTPEVRVRLVDLNNKQFTQLGDTASQAVAVIVERPSHVALQVLKFANYTRENLNWAVRKFLIIRGVRITPRLPIVPKTYTSVTDAQKQAAARWEQELKEALQVSDLTSVVLQMDLEGALIYIFEQEVSLTDEIRGEPLNVLKRFVAVLSKYFPTGRRGKRFLREFQKKVMKKMDYIKGEDIKRVFAKLQDKYKPFMPNPEWLGCRGTIPMFRGYPCSMWTLFHTLVAADELHNRWNPEKTPEALGAMAGYIEHFFSCKTCSNHFTEMAKTIAGNVTSRTDAVMWLWKAHNHVNRQLAGDVTEDPRHHKVQFPTRALCPACHTSDGSWDEPQVFKFLSGKYTKIINFDPHHLLM